MYLHGEEACCSLCPPSMRVLPHQQDTGGFFVALLTKVTVLPWQKKVTKGGRREEEMTMGGSVEEEEGEREKEGEEEEGEEQGGTVDRNMEGAEEEEKERTVGRSVEGEEEGEEVVTVVGEEKEQAGGWLRHRSHGNRSDGLVASCSCSSAASVSIVEPLKETRQDKPQ